MNRLHIRLISLIIGFVFFSSILIGAVNMYLSVNVANSQLLDDEQDLASQMASEVENFMEDASNMMEGLAMSPAFYAMDSNEIRETLLAIQQKHPQFELIYAMDTTGQQIAKTNNMDLANRADRPYFKDALSGKTLFTDSYISIATNEPCITISTSIKNPAGQIVGVLSGDVSLKSLSKISKILKMCQNGYMDIVDQKGTLLVHPDKERINNRDTIADKPYIQQVLNGKSGIGEEMSSIGSPSLLAYAPINIAGWGVIIYQPKSEYTKMVTQSFGMTLLLVLFVVIIASTVGARMARSLSQPLRLLAISADKMAGGDLRQPIEVQGVAEINHLAGSLETMRQSLLNIIDAEKKAKEQQISLNQMTKCFVPHEFLGSLQKNNIMEIKPGDHVEKEITVLFTDIRSYTKISEGMTSIEIFNFLNDYLNIAIDVIVKNHGFIDKFIGDAIMGLFAKSADDALLAIVELFKKLEIHNSQPGNIPIHIGAGIHYGSVTMGTVGNKQRMDTTVIGDTVNFASRLESATKTYGMSILISEQVYDKLKNPSKFNIREVDTVKVKGKNFPIKIYEVFDCDDSELKEGKIKIAQCFNEGLSLYKSGNFTEADQKFKECKNACPNDKLLEVYIKRCGVFVRIPPGADWSGVSGI